MSQRSLDGIQYPVGGCKLNAVLKEDCKCSKGRHYSQGRKDNRGVLLGVISLLDELRITMKGPVRRVRSKDFSSAVEQGQRLSYEVKYVVVALVVVTEGIFAFSSSFSEYVCQFSPDFGKNYLDSNSKISDTSSSVT